MLSENALGSNPEEQLHHARAELSRRLRAGEDCRAESFFDSYPALSSHVDYVLELILTEFALRRELGQQPNPADWYARFPHWQEQLAQRFERGQICGDSAVPDAATVERTPPTTPADDLEKERAGASFAHYEVLGELGRGGMGVVYKARDVLLGREVALKMIRAGALAQAEEIQRFYREARAVAQLKHPHIINVYEIRQDESRHYFTMAYAPGGSLAQHRERFAADPRATAALMEKIARAVHYAHAKGILHRDLKPGNVLLDEHGEPLVSDFGLAKFLDADAVLTQSGQIVGTPAYMGPELLASEPAPATVQSDVWALGVILYELLTGQRPFSGKGFKEVTRQILESAPPRLQSLRRSLDRPLETIVLKCLEKEPARRYGSAEALADDLGRWRRGELIAARPPSWPRRAWHTLRSHWLAGLAVVFVAILGVALPVALHFSDPDRPLQRLQRELAEAKAITLIGPTGPPAWSRWALGEAMIKHSDQEQAFTLDAGTQTCLLELMRNLPQQHYRFSAEVFNHDSDHMGQVGIYFFEQQLATPQGVQHCLCLFTFNDHKALDQQGRTQARCYLARHLENRVFSSRSLARASFPPAFRTKQGLRWRTLSVVVHPDTLECFWEGESLGRVERRVLLDYGRDIVPRNPPFVPTFSPRGALGLCVRGASASFRRVTVVPLQ